MYKQFILEMLCYPNGHFLPDVPYGLDRVEAQFHHLPDRLEGKTALVVFVDYRVEQDSVKPVFRPLRLATIERSQILAGKLLLDLALSDYMYYDTRERNATGPWNAAISELDEAPRVERVGSRIEPGDSSTWKSGGKFVLEIGDGRLDLRPDATKEPEIRSRADDWKSIVDLLAETKQLGDKLFYQIQGLVRMGKAGRVPLSAEDNRAAYQVKAGESVDLILHFYHGKKRRSGHKRMLRVSTESDYLKLLGGPTVDVYPEQISGKVHRLRVIAKKQLAEGSTRIAIRENISEPGAAGFVPALASTELSLRIKPRGFYIGSILALFVVGTLFNSVPDDPEGTWLLKVTGAGLMGLAFWLAFSKFPST